MLIANSDDRNCYRPSYVFGMFVLDLYYERESYAVPYAWRTYDCSNPDFFCLKSGGGASPGFANFVVPRQCTDLAVGMSWTHAGLTTRVFSAEPVGEEGFVLVTDGIKNAVLYYEPERGIFRTDFGLGDSGISALARAGRDWRGGVAKGLGGPLITNHPLASCKLPKNRKW
ncbi:MAG: hypothetical protein K2Y20_12415 [Sphingomonas sp.]|nr:hypothetical protein [Sphingomonas sp.]